MSTRLSIVVDVMRGYRDQAETSRLIANAWGCSKDAPPNAGHES